MTAWLAVATLVAVGVATAQGVESEPPIREQHIVQVDGHPVAVWSRRPAEPHAVLLLVHGRTWSSLPDFDLQVPRVNRSVLVSMAARGIATYAVDLRGYGATPADSSGWLTPERAAADVQAVLRWVAGRHPDLPPPVLAGWSRGAAIALLAGQQAPELTSGLVVYGFAFDPDGTFVDEIAPAGAVPRVPNTAEAARVDFISPTVTAPAVIRAFVGQALAADPIRANVTGDSQFEAIAPAAFTRPVLFVYGSRDPTIAPGLVDRLAATFPRPGPAVVVLAGGDHAAHLESTHEAWIEAVSGFVQRVSRSGGFR